MNASGDFERVRVVVFGGFPGARYRAGRTLRILKRRFARVVDATVASLDELSKFIPADDAPLWLVRAGALPFNVSHWFRPPPPPSGKALCAFGILFNAHASKRSDEMMAESLRAEWTELAGESEAWAALQKETGGDFCIVNRLAEKLPRIASVLLDAALVPGFSKCLSDGKTVDAALRAVLAATPARCVRLPHLDVTGDPALRVAQVVTSLQRGGAERIALDLTRELPRCGIRPLFFALGSPTRAAFEKPDDAVEFQPGQNRAEHVRHFADRAVALGCDAVHAHLLSASDMALVAEFGIPIVATVHNLRQGWPAGFAGQESHMPATFLAACSQAVERDIAGANFGAPVRTVWNGIEGGAFEPSSENTARAREWREKLEFLPSDFVVLSLANPRPQKRLERLPAVLTALRTELKIRGVVRESKLIVAGEASRSSPDAIRCDAALRSEIERLQLADAVRVIGAAQHIAPLLLASDALISVSEWEGLSLAHLEALAAGIAVVATDAGGTAEIAPENPALAIVPLDAGPETIASKLADVAEKQNGAAERERMDARKRSSFTIQIMVQRYASLYPRAIEFARGARRGEGVWLVANNFTTGGAQSSARRLLLGMKAQHVAVRAAVLQEREDNPTPGLSALRENGVPVFIPEPRSADPLDAVMQIIERIDADPPRAILFWNVIAEHKVLLADAIWDIPIFDVSPGEMFFDSLDSYFARPRPGLPYRNATDYGARLAGVVVKYRAEAVRAEASLKTKTHVIPNGLPIKERACDKVPTDGRIVIGTSARISPQKKLEELIDALRIAATRLPPHVLRIAGRPERGAEEYAERLKSLSADLSVEWVGEFQDSENFLGGLDIFAMISEPAGCPNASLEALAAGLAVIVTDHGGASEQVEDGVSGRLTPRGDARAFVDALVELAHDPARRRALGEAGRARVETCFSLERMVGDYRKLCGV